MNPGIPSAKDIIQGIELPQQEQEQAPSSAAIQFSNNAAAICENPEAIENAFLAWQLVRCTLPHSNPGDVPVWKRTNGNLTLGIKPGWDYRKNQSIGFPFGVIPRLLLFWVTTEAVQKKSRRLELGDSRRLELGDSLTQFMTEIGLNPRNGTDKRSDARRLRDQMNRLFASTITFQQDLSNGKQVGDATIDMQVAPLRVLWWDPKRPDQTTLWDSYIELGEYFFKAITAAPVPVDKRCLRALKKSPLALDLYAWATYKAFAASTKRIPIFVSWADLKAQLGADYAEPREFKRKVRFAIRKVKAVYPGFKIQPVKDGFNVLPDSTPSVPRKVDPPVKKSVGKADPVR